MSDKQETADDIIREMRADMCIPHHIDWADRLEAARKREHGALVAEAEAAKDARNKVAVRLREEFAEKCRECKAQPGNAAALREALESMSENLAMHVRCGRFVAPGDHVSFPISEAEAYIRDIRAALSEPPRNCDRYRTEAEAEAAFDRFCLKARTGECKPGECPLRSNGGRYCYVAWLLGTEGGAE